MPERSEYAKRYYKLNKFIILEKQMEYYHNNKEKINRRMRERYYEICSDPTRRQERLDYLKEWRKNNLDKSAMNSRRYYQRNKEEIKERARKNYHEKMDLIRALRDEHTPKEDEGKKIKKKAVVKIDEGLKEDDRKNLIKVVKKHVRLVF